MSRSIFEKIRTHAEKVYPEECCGATLGISTEGIQEIKETIELFNTENVSRARRFLITPEQYLQVEKLARQRNLDLIGFYHSHPDHPPTPSKFDLDNALPSMIYFVVSVLNGSSDGICVWRLNDDRRGYSEQTMEFQV